MKSFILGLVVLIGLAGSAIAAPPNKHHNHKHNHNHHHNHNHYNRPPINHHYLAPPRHTPPRYAPPPRYYQPQYRYYPYSPGFYYQQTPYGPRIIWIR